MLVQLERVESHSPELLTPSERFAEIVLEYERQCQVRAGSSPAELLWQHSCHLHVCGAL